MYRPYICSREFYRELPERRLSLWKTVNVDSVLERRVNLKPEGCACRESADEILESNEVVDL